MIVHSVGERLSMNQQSTNNNNKQFVLGKGIVKKTNFSHSVQPHIQYHNSDKIGNIQIKDKNTKLTEQSSTAKLTTPKGAKELKKTLHVNNKRYLTKLISGGGFVKLH
jgi:hypothetical protein